jgi:sugar O-acyltransferase (sialic acid O-acetyltransferase NeuD family)
MDILIYGAGGFGREVAWLVESCSTANDPIRVVAFVDDDNDLHGTYINEIPVTGLAAAREQHQGARIVGGLGGPGTREASMERAAAAGFEFATLIHPGVERSRWLDIGEGTVICAGTILTTNITLGRHVQINLDCTVGHNVVMGAYTTLTPGVHVSGWVHMGERVYVGTGAAIIDGTSDAPLILGDDVVVGAGALVTRSVEPGTVVVGVPAKPRS